ncbi:ATP-binding protein [Streptomyces regensis]|uniref:tRNA threonylcarbamoyladenosine biosynthesis protein TsaE n=1 Tax=Prauserella rugosa TaxID=43354 RepID=A0A660CME2_9PSEU|nr:ATP-binding protein [Streptomyces regensis]TWH22265.1 tRNA threonylcarbamoyladenosine biosynthesis protein TsaE [Prauserella rugosa]
MVAPVSIELTTADDAIRFGRTLGGALRPGDLVLLAGPLGAGKTTMTRGIAEGMGVSGRVSSPTFVLARVHPAGADGGTPLVHVDAYRLGGDLSELDDLDLDAELESSAVVVEWGEGLAEPLSEDRLVVRIERHADDTRTVTFEPHGTWTGRVDSLT